MFAQSLQLILVSTRLLPLTIVDVCYAVTCYSFVSISAPITQTLTSAQMLILTFYLSIILWITDGSAFVQLDAAMQSHEKTDSNFFLQDLIRNFLILSTRPLIRKYATAWLTAELHFLVMHIVTFIFSKLHLCAMYLIQYVCIVGVHIVPLSLWRTNVFSVLCTLRYAVC